MKKLNGIFKQYNFSYLDLISYFLCFLFVVCGAAVSINRYWQYESFYIDFGIFDQAIWSVSRFSPPIIEHIIVGGKWIFADHFSPGIFLLSPFYWITNRSEMLFIVQAAAVGLSGVILYHIGKRILNNKFLSLAILFCYLFFVGLQNAVISEFHEITVATLPLMLTFWAIVNKKVKLYFLFLIITLAFKESFFATGIAIGITTFFIQKSWRKIAMATILISIIWGVVAIKFIIPAFSNGLYIYSPTLPPGVFDKLFALVDSSLKIRTLFFSFLSFGFLPLLSPSFWPLIIQDYALRFLPAGFDTRWDLGLHYNAQSAVILSVSAIFGLKNLRKIKHISKLIIFLGIILILNSIILFRFILHGPFALAYNPIFYEHTNDFGFLNDLVKKIPPNVTVMTQNNLAARFTHQKVWLLKEDYEVYKPEYILIDLRDGQNANDFFGTSSSTSKILSELKKDKNYKIIFQTKDQFIFRRI